MALIQEPWISSGNQVSGLRPRDFNTYFSKVVNRIRSVILVRKNLCSYILYNYSTDDLAVVALENGKDDIILLASCYMAHNRDAPPVELQRLVEETGKRKQNLVVGTDANAHHTVWGSKDINDRGESLISFILQTSLKIANRGDIPTYKGPTSENVLDLTLFSDFQVVVDDWKVLKVPTFSDHCYIHFQVSYARPNNIKVFRNPRNADWTKYSVLMNSELGHSRAINSADEVDSTVDKLVSQIVKSYEASCPPARTKRKSRPPWWSKQLDYERRELRELFKLAKISEQFECWEEYRDAQRIYKRSVRKAKRTEWKSFCGNIEKTKDTARLRKMFASNPVMPSTICKENGEWTESSAETLQVLLDTHFPGCSNITTAYETTINTEMNDGGIVSYDKVEWAIDSFQPYKSPGVDDIIPAQLQHGKKCIIPWLVNIFNGCLRLNYVPESWRIARIIFLPKSGKCSHVYPKDFRPISLTSFLLKTLERVLDFHIKDKLEPTVLSSSQHAYTKGKSVETALHSVVSQIERNMHFKDVAMGVFLDIAGAFNNVSTEAILESVGRTGAQVQAKNWISSLLKCRIVSAEWGNTVINKTAHRGTPQGGVLSPLLWTLVLNELLRMLEGRAAKVTAYADDVAVIVTGKHLSTISSVMEATLRIIHQWATRVGLAVNPEKTDLVIFTWRTKFDPWEPPKLGGTVLAVKDHTKYLGVILDSKLLWKLNVEERVKKASNALYACKTMLGKTWGLTPKLTHWVYTAVARPILLYGVLVWWTAMEKKTYRKRLESVQRLAELSITGALRSTPTAALDVILNLKPINLVASGIAKKSAVRLKAAGQFACKPYGHSKIIGGFDVSTDYIVPRLTFYKKIQTTLEEGGWLAGLRSEHMTLNFFTDGSKMLEGVRAAVYCQELGIEESYKLPDTCSIFQAEILAAKMAAELALTDRTYNSQINLFVDSQAAIKAISATSTYSSIVQECKESLSRLSTVRRVHIYWVRGHVGIEGNERADELAKRGVRLPDDRAVFVRAPIQNIKADIDSKFISPQTWNLIDERASFKTKINSINDMTKRKEAQNIDY